MTDFLNRLTSRKFLLTILGIVIAIGQMATGTLSADQAIDAIKVLIVAFIAAEGVGDAADRLKPSIPPAPEPVEPQV